MCIRDSCSGTIHTGELLCPCAEFTFFFIKHPITTLYHYSVINWLILIQYKLSLNSHLRVLIGVSWLCLKTSNARLTCELHRISLLLNSRQLILFTNWKCSLHLSQCLYYLAVGWLHCFHGHVIFPKYSSTGCRIFWRGRYIPVSYTHLDVYKRQIYKYVS